MGNKKHREYKKQQKRFHNQWATKAIENTKKNKDFKINDSGSRSLVLKSCCFCCFVVLDGFRYPLVLKSYFCFCLVFSMVLATHWFWNLGFLVFCWIFSMALAIPYIISAVRFLRFPRGCLTECSLHAHGMSNGMPPGCLAGCQDSTNPPCITTLTIDGIPYYRKAKPFTIGGNPLL